MTDRLTPRDRLVAGLEGMVIGDRWGASLTPASEAWQPSFLQIVDGVQGGALTPALWRRHCRSVTHPAAVLITLVPQLWRQADAYGHHRGAVGAWVADLGLSAAIATAADGLFMLLCQRLGGAEAQGFSAVEPGYQALAEAGLTGVVESLIQTQHQLPLGLALGQRRGERGPGLALIGLLAGLRGGRSSLGTGLRLRWLNADPALGADPWPGVDADYVGTLASALHHCWAGLGPVPLTGGPSRLQGGIQATYNDDREE